MPKRVRAYFKFDRALLQHLYTAAWQSWQELMLREYPSGTCGAVLALHTAGDLLAFHPHIHGIFLSGVVLPNGSFAPVVIDQEELQELFANKVLRALHAAGHLSEQDVDNILSWKHSGFSTFVGDPIDPADKQRLLFAARYLKKCPLSNERINIIEHNGTTTIEYRCAKDGTANTRTFDPLQFLAELSQHIPNTWEQTTRHLGAYSCRTRGAARLREPVDDPTKELPEPIVRPSKNWARLMKKVFELNPLLCPKCGAEMVIKAFITDSREIDRIMAACAIQQRAPPKLKYTAPLAA